MGCLQPSGQQQLAHVSLDEQEQKSNAGTSATKIFNTLRSGASSMAKKIENALSEECPTCNGMNMKCRTCRGKGRIANGFQSCTQCETKGCDNCMNVGYTWPQPECKEFHDPFKLPLHPPSDGTCPKCKGKGGWFLGPSTNDISAGIDVDDWEQFGTSLCNVKRHCPACDGLAVLPPEATLCDKCSGLGWWNGKNDAFAMYHEWHSRDSASANSCDKCYGRCYINYDYKSWYHHQTMICPYCECLGGFWNRVPMEITTNGFNDKVECPCCDGERYILAYSRQCRKCYGKGYFDKTFTENHKYYDPGCVFECNNCAGRGYVNPPWARGGQP